MTSIDVPGGPGSLRSRAAGASMVAGGILAAVTVAMPPAASGSDVFVLAAGALAGVVGAALLIRNRDEPAWLLAAVIALGTALITLATHAGGSGNTGTADNEMLYVWVGLYSFYFLGLRIAIAETSLVGIAYAWLLSTQGVGADEAATRWVVTMATLLVTGIIVARLRASLEAMFAELTERARIDSLTGLVNRRALEERAGVEFARLHRGGGSLAMLVIDIDGFKAFNDTLGHHAGDRVLTRVAEVLETETRQVDVVARTGGDEFAVLMPAVTAKAARTIAERLRAAVRQSASDVGLGLTVSVGLAIAPNDGVELDGLWKAADRAMYLAKRIEGDAVAESPGAEAAVITDDSPALRVVEG